MAFEKTKEKLAELKKKRIAKKAERRLKKLTKAGKVKQISKKGKVGHKPTKQTVGGTEDISVSGKIRRGAVGAKKTEKGGYYPEYKKKSKPAKSFRSAFAAARKAGKSSFSWDGRSYSTARADDKKKAKTVKKVTPKKAAPKKDVPKKVKKLVYSPLHPPNVAIKASPKPVDYKEPKKAAPKKDVPKKDVPKKKPGMFSNPGEKYPGNYEGGGIVESNPFGWPSKDARNGGKK